MDDLQKEFPKNLHPFQRNILRVTDSAGLMTYIQKGCAKIDFKALVDDLRPFVFNPSHADRILLFTAYVETHAGLLEN
jgi:hypothetical protein